MLLSFYLIEEDRGRQKRFWLSSIDHRPTNWVELKFMLEGVMRTVYIEHVAWDDIVRSCDTGEKIEPVRECKALITLEHHLSGKYRTGSGTGYQQKKIAVRREYEAVFKLVYNDRNGELTVKDAQFGPGLSHLREDYWRIERGIQYRTPPLIPKDHRDPLDPKGMVMEVPATRYADYRRKEHSTYDINEDQRQRMYSRPQTSLYVRERGRLRSE